MRCSWSPSPKGASCCTTGARTPRFAAWFRSIDIITHCNHNVSGRGFRHNGWGREGARPCGAPVDWVVCEQAATVVRFHRCSLPPLARCGQRVGNRVAVGVPDVTGWAHCREQRRRHTSRVEQQERPLPSQHGVRGAVAVVDTCGVRRCLVPAANTVAVQPGQQHVPLCGSVAKHARVTCTDVRSTHRRCPLEAARAPRPVALCWPPSALRRVIACAAMASSNLK